VAGTRRPQEFKITLVHAGPHYATTCEVFFDDLRLRATSTWASVRNHAERTARVMLAFRSVVKDADPDLVVVVGDVITWRARWCR
jgi:UDP-N-acetylglucosamine 2-epimerase